MKTHFKLWHFVLLLAAISFYSCGEDEDDCTLLTWYADVDGDGLGDPATSTLACTQPSGFVDNSDDPEDCITTTWYRDLDGDGLGDPDNSQEACEQPEGFVTDNSDDQDCIVTTWYEDFDGDGLGNPEVSQEACEQPEGFVDNSDDNQDRAETIILFESVLESLTEAPSDWRDVFDSSNGRFRDPADGGGQLNGGSADGITAAAGNNYITFIESDRERDGQARFRFENTDNPLDISEFTDPHINVWLNSGSAVSNVMAFDMDLRDADRHEESGGDGNLSTFFTWEQDQGDPDQDTNLGFYESLANNGIIANNTGGEWVLYSIPLSDPNWMLAGNTSSEKVGLTGREDGEDVQRISRLRFNLDMESTLLPVNPAEGVTPSRSGDFVVHIDEISISDGPLIN